MSAHAPDVALIPERTLIKLLRRHSPIRCYDINRPAADRLTPFYCGSVARRQRVPSRILRQLRAQHLLYERERPLAADEALLARIATDHLFLHYSAVSKHEF
jgi:hypothetical protein